MQLKNYKLTEEGKLYYLGELKKSDLDSTTFENSDGTQNKGKDLTEQQIISLLLEDGFICSK